MNRAAKGCAQGASLALLLIGLGGCGPSGADYCEDRRECMGGNDADEDACNAYFDYHQEMADVQGCSDEFDEYFECFFDKAKCLTDDTGSACSTNADCAPAGYGATCAGGTCIVKDLGLQGAEECAEERLKFQQCNSLDREPFGQ